MPLTFKKKKSVVLPSRKQAMLVAVLIVAVFAIGKIVPMLVDSEGIKNEFVAKVSERIGRKVHVNKLPYVKVFPFPKVVIEEVYIENNRKGVSDYMIKLPRVVLGYGLLNLMKKEHGDPTFIQLESPEVVLEQYAGKENNWTTESGESLLIGMLAASHSASGIDLSFAASNAHIVFNDISKRKNIELDIPDLDVELNGQKAGINGQVKEHGVVYQFKTTIEPSDSSSSRKIVSSISSNVIGATLDGQIDFSPAFKLNGNLTAKVPVGKVAEGAEQAQDNTNMVSISSPITVTSEDFYMKGIAIDSNYIKGGGDYQYVGGNQKRFSLKMDLDFIDLDFFMPQIRDKFKSAVGKSAETKDDKDIPDVDEKPKFASIDPFETFLTMNGAMDIKFKQTKALGETLGAAVADMTADDGEITINQAQMELPGGGNLAVFGFISKSADGDTKFDGNVEASGKSLRKVAEALKINMPQYEDPNIFGPFSLDGNFNVIRNEVQFTEALAVVDDVSVTGVMLYQYKEIPSIEVRLRIDKLDMGKFKPRKEDIKVKGPGERALETEYKGRFAWIRDFGIKLTGIASIKDFKTDGMDFKDVIFAGSVEKDLIKFSELNATLGESRVNGNGSVDLTHGLPIFSANLDFNTLDLDEWYKKVDETVPGVEEKEIKVQPVKEKTRWSEDKIILNSLRDVEGDFKVSASKFKYRDFEVEKMKAAGNLKSESVNLETFSGTLYGGDLELKGDLYAGSIPGFSFSFGLTGCDSAKLFKQFLKVENISGKSTVTGVVKSSGIDELSWVTNLEGNIALGSSEFHIVGFDLPSFARRAANVRSVADVVDLSKISFSKGQTIFTQLDSAMTIIKGQVTFTKADAGTDAVKASFSGNVDLPAWLMNGVAQFSLSTSGSEDLPPLYLKVKGSVDSPDMVLDTNAVELFIAKKSTEKLIKSDQ